MWERRTDLVLERQESADVGALAGVKSSVRRQGPLQITDITVLNEQGARALGKPPGRYLTAELPAGAAEGREISLPAPKRWRCCCARFCPKAAPF